MLIIDLLPVIQRIKTDRNLWIARDAMEVPEIVTWLIEEPPIPRDYPILIDTLCEYVDARPDLINVIAEDSMDIMVMQLEVYQLQLDQLITRGIPEDVLSFEYEVVKWLGDTTALISVNTYDKARYPPHTLRKFKND